MSSSRHQHRHFQYTLDLVPPTIPQLGAEVKLSALDEFWVKTFLRDPHHPPKDPFWVTIANEDFI